MCWQCDNPNGTADEYLDELRETIGAYGWAVQFVESDDRPLAYTIGLHERGLPELVMTGQEKDTAARVLNLIAEQMADGEMVLAPGERIGCGKEFLLEVVEIEHPDVHLDVALALANMGVRALQLVWADDRGRWPWDRGWGHGPRRQPVLGVRVPRPEK